MAETRRDRVTLAALLAVLQERDRAFIVHRMGPHECEGVAGGTIQELRSTRCVEVCGDNVVERLAMDLDEWPEVWPSDDPAPVLVITIGEKEKTTAPDRPSADVAYQPDNYDIRSLIAKHAQEC